MKITENRIAQNTEKSKPESERYAAFNKLKRDFETAYESGKDYSTELMQLSTAIARSILATVADPQRKTANGKSKVSDSGMNKAIDDMRKGLTQDRKNLDSLRYWTNQPYEIAYDKNGNKQTVYTANAVDAIDSLIDYALSDGMDFVQLAAVELLQLAAEHAANGDCWLDMPYSVRRLSKRVYIRETDSKAYRMEDTTPIQEIYRAIRRYVAECRQVSTDPRSKYTYVSIDALEPEELEQIFVRSGKYADIGGMDCNGLYTSDIESFRAYADADKLLETLNLTARELQIIKLRMQGYGTRSIATYIGVSHGSIERSIKNIRNKAMENGLHN